MNAQAESPKPGVIRLAFYCIGILGVLLVMVALVGLLRRHAAAPAMDQGRVEERLKAASETRQEAAKLGSYGYIDPIKRQVRLPIDRAMELTLQQWRDPAAGHAQLKSRLEHFSKPAPAGANPFE